MLCLLLASAAYAYETDQLTDRLEVLADATALADEEADRLLAIAIQRTNAETRCKADTEATRRILANRIAEVTARPQYVPERKMAGFGYGVYAAWLETGPIERRSFFVRDDLYGALTPGESPVLSTVGTCSTIRLAGQLVGTDKPDHFWGLGYQYAQASAWGKDPAAALRWGTLTEKTFYGLLTSNVFSYADLAANYAGYQFYVGLLSEGSAIQRGPDDCVEQERGFEWREWVTPDWDEVWNPSVYNRYVQAAVQDRLRARRGEYCTEYLKYRDDYLPRLATALSEHPLYAAARAPDHRDSFELESVCADYIVAALERGETHTPGPVDVSLLLHPEVTARRARPAAAR